MSYDIQILNAAWTQATLPVSRGGLGLRPAIEVSLSAYLSSVEATGNIVQSLLPDGARNFQNKHYDIALYKWKLLSGMENPPQNSIFQSEWDRPVAESTLNFLLQTAPSEAERARLLSVSAESASDWLHAIPIPSLGLQLDPMSLKIACGLHLGSPLCHQHKCICGVMVQGVP